MALLLTNEDVEKVLTMPETISSLQRAYQAAAAGGALSRPRSDILMPGGPDGSMVYGFKTMEGAWAEEGLVALRLNSDLIRWPDRGGVVVREKVPALPGGRWLGLILLFSARTGELLAIIPDGIIQRMRVGGTSALAAMYLARADAAVVGLIGSGWQAGAQLLGLCAVRPIKEVRVFSPNPAHREAFAAEWGPKLQVAVVPVQSAAAAVAGSDVVALATSAVEPVLDASCLSPGQHVSAIKRGEIGDDILANCHVLVVHWREGVPEHRLVGGLEVPALAKAYRPLSREPDGDILSLVRGQVRRTGPEQVTCFLNNIGLGLQFAAVGGLVYQKAAAAGLGRELPGEWFTEDVHP